MVKKENEERERERERESDIRLETLPDKSTNPSKQL